MLILSRKIQETIMIGEDVRVTILGIHGRQVRISVDAPKSVPVHRLEVFQKIKAQEEAAKEASKVSSHQVSKASSHKIRDASSHEVSESSTHEASNASNPKEPHQQ